MGKHVQAERKDELITCGLCAPRFKRQVWHALSGRFANDRAVLTHDKWLFRSPPSLLKLKELERLRRLVITDTCQGPQ